MQLISVCYKKVTRDILYVQPLIYSTKSKLTNFFHKYFQQLGFWNILIHTLSIILRDALEKRGDIASRYYIIMIHTENNNTLQFLSTVFFHIHDVSKIVFFERYTNCFVTDIFTFFIKCQNGKSFMYETNEPIKYFYMSPYITYVFLYKTIFNLIRETVLYEIINLC